MVECQPSEETAKGSDEEEIRSSPLVSPKTKNQQGGSKGPSQPGSEKLRETERGDKVELGSTKLATPPPPPGPPLGEPIDPLVRPRGLPILVPGDLAVLDMLSNLPIFLGAISSSF